MIPFIGLIGDIGYTNSVVECIANNAGSTFNDAD